jgi:hypothetical protein
MVKYVFGAIVCIIFGIYCKVAYDIGVEEEKNKAENKKGEQSV